MFSEEAMVNMADGTVKSISLIVARDYILDKFNNPVKVTRLIKTIQQVVQMVQLNNNTDPFYITSDTLFLCVYVYNNGINITSEYTTMDIIQKFNGQLKSSLKVFSKESNASILMYNTDLIRKDVYTLELQNSDSYLVCNIITTV